MAMVNFSVCLVLVLYQLSVVYSDEASSESADLGLSGKFFRTLHNFRERYLNTYLLCTYLHTTQNYAFFKAIITKECTNYVFQA